MAKKKEKPSAFISYTHGDAEFARRLAKDLESLDVAIWLDERELSIGDSIISGVEEGIEKCRWMIVVLSPEALKSNWVLRELRAGLTRELSESAVYVLPVLCKATQLPALLRDKFYADCTDSYEHGLQLLKDRILGNYRPHAGVGWLLVRRPASLALVLDNLELGELSSMQSEPTLLELTTSLANPNRRETLALVSIRDALDRGGRKKEGLATLWFGRTGRLILRVDGANVTGDYDWHGLSFAGRIAGHADQNKILFAWDWSGSTERGHGIFWTDTPHVLHGGWWMDYEALSLDDVAQGKAQPTHRWEFVDVTGLDIVPAEEPGSSAV